MPNSWLIAVRRWTRAARRDSAGAPTGTNPTSPSCIASRRHAAPAGSAHDQSPGHRLEAEATQLPFNGHGLGWHGAVGHLECLGIAVAVYVAVHALCGLRWRGIGQGPLEATLRAATRGRARPAALPRPGRRG